MSLADFRDCKNSLCPIHGNGGWIKRTPWKNWSRAKQSLKTLLPKGIYDRWIEPVLAFQGIENTEDDPRLMISLVVQRSSDVPRMKKHYGPAIEAALSGLIKEQFAIEYVPSCNRPRQS